MNLTACGNYQLISQEIVSEIKSESFLYKHAQSGARVLFLESEDDNKVFCASFKTPPVDDTGVAHIMEHSVLCGSSKYPVKEPFVELMKSSLNTFLNAMTYPDKTIYPVASRNHSDFQNLADVYLDAVFFPELSQQAFEQEGWHYELEKQGLSYKGVVFNEMKGVFSSPESYLDVAVNRALFPDSSYRFESGGIPAAIPDLTYEQYLQFHREKYHPSNAWLIISGDVDREYWLEYLDTDYLSKFKTPDFELPELLVQKPLTTAQNIHCTYPANDESTEDNCLMLLSYVIGDSTDSEFNFAMGVLDAILLGSAASPLKKALLESQLGEDTLDYGYMNETLQTTWSVGLRDTSAKKATEFKELVLATLQKIVDEGVPAKQVEAALNSCEFALREANFGSYPKGLVYSMNIMNRWLYGDDSPLQGLKYEELMISLKEKIAAGGYFEQLIRQCFLENNHQVLAICSPQSNLAKLQDETESERLAVQHGKMSPQDLETLKQENEILNERQQSPDSPEALATIPHVSVADLPNKIESIPSEEIELGGARTMYHDLPSQGIIYSQFSFDCAAFAEEDYPYIALLNALLLKCGTRNFSYDEFSQNMFCYTGGVSSGFSIYSTKLRDTSVGSRISIKGKVMKDKLPELVKILGEVFSEIDFADHKRIKELLGSLRSRLKTSLLNNGDRTARGVLGAALSPSGYLNNLVSGPDYLHFLDKINCELAENPAAITEKLLAVKNKLFCKSNLFVNLTADKEHKSDLKTLETAINKLPNGSVNDASASGLMHMKNTALHSTGSVQYIAKGINISDMGYKVHGSLDLLNQLLSTGYLWEKVRVLGGAYGCYMICDKISGSLQLVSYRDPNLQETIDVYDALGDFLENLQMSQLDLEKLIIGTVGRLDSPLTTSQKGGASFSRYLAGISEEELNLRRSELLNCTVDDLRGYAPYFKKLAKDGILCVHGSEKSLTESASLFETSIQLES